MQDQNQLLREALERIIQWDDAGLALTEDLIANAKAALAQPAEGGEAVYQCQGADGRWTDQTRESYDYNVKHGQAVVRVLYTTPPASQGHGLTVIDPDAWEPCTPEYLFNGGDCNAPRVWHEASHNHWHPKRKDSEEQPSPASPADMAVYQSIADGYTNAQQPKAVQPEDCDDLFCCYAQIVDGAYKLFNCRTNKVMADGKVHPMYSAPIDLQYWDSRDREDGPKWRAHIAKAQQPSEEVVAWQPIETAPKDGRTMFVVKAVDVIHHPGAMPYTSDPWCVWQDADGFSRWPHAFNPTHWMPLPPITKSQA